MSKGFALVDLQSGGEWVHVIPDRDIQFDVYLRGDKAIFIVTPKDALPATIGALSKKSGQKLWDVKLPFTKGLRVGWSPGWGTNKRFDNRVIMLYDTADRLVLAGETEEAVTIVALSVDAGKLLWTQTDVPQKIEKPKGDLGPIKPDNYLYSTDAYLVGDSTLLVASNVQSAGGEPFAINVEDGSVAWKAEIAFDANVLCGTCTLLQDGTLYVKHGPNLNAINVETGETIWSVKTEAGPALQIVKEGLLAGCFVDTCYSTLELRDPGSGRSHWDGPVRLTDKEKAADRLWTGAVLVDDERSRVVFTEDKLIKSVDLATGDVMDFASHEFKFKEAPNRFIRHGAQLVLLSEQNIAAYGADRQQSYFRAYTPPKMGVWTYLGRQALVSAINAGLSTAASRAASTQARQNAYLNALATGRSTGTGYGVAFYQGLSPVVLERYRFSQHTADFTYIYTSDSTPDGVEGFSLVRIQYVDGAEVSRAWVNQRKPDLTLDPIAPMAYARLDSKHIVAVPFVSGAEKK